LATCYSLPTGDVLCSDHLKPITILSPSPTPSPAIALIYIISTFCLVGFIHCHGYHNGIARRGRKPIQPVGHGVQNRPERVRAPGGPERHGLPKRHQCDDGPEPNVLYFRVCLPINVLDTRNSCRFRRGNHAHDRRRRGQHAGHHCHRD